MNKKLIFAACFLSAGFALSAQEALKSVEEEYYDFLALDGVTERPALNYRTMSNSIWTIREDNTPIAEFGEETIAADWKEWMDFGKADIEARTLPIIPITTVRISG